MSNSLHDKLLAIIEASSSDAGDGPSNAEGKKDLKRLKFTRFLRLQPNEKSVYLEGEYDNEKAVIILAKTSFPTDLVSGAIEDLPTSLGKFENLFRNDKYGSYLIELLGQEFNQISLTVIHPATQKDVDKYVDHKYYFVKETPELYRSVTLPFIEQQLSQPGHLAWLYNVLEKKAETDRIVYEEAMDTSDGFLIAKDMKWKTKGDIPTEAEKIDLYVNTLIARRDIRSLRDLRAEHLSLLHAINTRGRQAVAAAYGLNERELRLFIHYQPQFYHLHVHISHVKNPMASALSDRAHQLEHVIDNIQLLGDYYARATLSFCLSEASALEVSAFK